MQAVTQFDPHKMTVQIAEMMGSLAETMGAHSAPQANTSFTVACTHNHKERLLRTLRGLVQLHRPASRWGW
jgi:hypothetical protein